MLRSLLLTITLTCRKRHPNASDSYFAGGGFLVVNLNHRPFFFFFFFFFRFSSGQVPLLRPYYILLTSLLHTSNSVP